MVDVEGQVRTVVRRSSQIQHSRYVGRRMPLIDKLADVGRLGRRAGSGCRAIVSGGSIIAKRLNMVPLNLI